MTGSQLEPIGVILAGGRGQRMGGAKATVMLGGRPLITYPLRALSAVLDDVVVQAKADTELPSLPGTTVWIESEPHRHPLIGIVEALGLAGGRPVLVCAVDIPFVTHRDRRPSSPARAASCSRCSAATSRGPSGCWESSTTGRCASTSRQLGRGCSR
jgi:molybdopterin-guanine dinucleotide biosynthesis protein A